ncbi:peptidoglycan editing factor PgeF [Marinobacter sp. X15-166B]|uniref:peptidoglycan editing factor PgeF n=1 Tax=Marinobacter sp. X15-166B TaxID=1897620 RepID=UPI00085C3DF4|nr:peptidoglycan editing factor PgeF [Marinobacter sp. X15-166B]OEY66666.1 multi-copper polyphenol oxidoreductase [Marinobacter sp. X15-166B]
MTTEVPLIVADWPAPSRVRAVSTLRMGGVSQGPWASLNLGTHVQDAPRHVSVNRQRLGDRLGVAEPAIGWLSQVHGTEVAPLPAEGVPQADASVTSHPGQVCAILTADCLPVLFCNRQGTRVAAAHAGWRGLSEGVLERTLAALGAPPEEILAWLGPAIGPAVFEVGPEVRVAFVARHPQTESAFVRSAGGGDRYLADIYQLARTRLELAGVSQVYGGGLCTVTDSTRFFSYRRDGVTGRMASLIWIEQ